MKKILKEIAVLFGLWLVASVVSGLGLTVAFPELERTLGHGLITLTVLIILYLVYRYDRKVIKKKRESSM